VIVGGDDVSYGKRPSNASNWREKMLKEVVVDPDRTHFLGRVSRSQFIRVLQVSAVHAYLTYPFVLSWSLLESMACGAAIVASDTAPVRDAIRDGANGRLIDFFQISTWSQRVLEGLAGDDAVIRARRQAVCNTQRFAAEGAVRNYERLLLASSQLRSELREVPTSDEVPGLQRSLPPRCVAC